MTYTALTGVNQLSAVSTSDTMLCGAKLRAVIQSCVYDIEG